MEQLTLIILVFLSMILVPFILLILLIWWFAKNRLIVQISEQDEGVLLSNGGRARVSKNGQLFYLFDFWGRAPITHDIVTGTHTIEKPPRFLFGGMIRISKGSTKTVTSSEAVPLLYKDIKDYIIVTEGKPIIGINKTLKLKRIGSKLMPWLPNFDTERKGYITSARMAKINELRIQLYESTKNELSRNEMLMQVMLPMGLILLAIVLIIFFPKMYTAIMQNSGSIFETSKSAVYDWLGQNPPVG